MGHDLPFIRSRRQAQSQDYNAPVSNRLTQVNVISNLLTGSCRKIEHIKVRGIRIVSVIFLQVADSSGVQVLRGNAAPAIQYLIDAGNSVLVDRHRHIIHALNPLKRPVIQFLQRIKFRLTGLAAVREIADEILKIQVFDIFIIRRKEVPAVIFL